MQAILPFYFFLINPLFTIKYCTLYVCVNQNVKIPVKFILIPSSSTVTQTKIDKTDAKQRELHGQSLEEISNLIVFSTQDPIINSFTCSLHFLVQPFASFSAENER